MTEDKSETNPSDEPQQRPVSVERSSDPLPWLIRSLRQKQYEESLKAARARKSRNEAAPETAPTSPSS